MKKVVKCKNKISGKCKNTGYECNHAIKHKENRFCNTLWICGKCVEVEK